MRTVSKIEQGSKSETAIQWLLEDLEHRAVIVLHRREAERIVSAVRYRALKKGIDVSKIRIMAYAYTTWCNVRPTQGTTKEISIMIDNVDLVLQAMLGSPITVATINLEK